MIQFKKINKIYPDKTQAIKALDLHIKPGEFVSIVGQSGSGKTTLIKLITAEEGVSDGKLIVGGWDITKIKASEVPVLRRQLGMIFQDFKLLSKKTVAENVAYALEVCNVKGKRIKQIVPQVLNIVGLENKIQKFPEQLSGGEKQRVAIARALVHRPKIILADEPTGNLDSLNAQEIIELLSKINKLGTTIILVTHNHDIVNALRKRVITIDQGSVISDQKSGKYIL